MRDNRFITLHIMVAKYDLGLISNSGGKSLIVALYWLIEFQL